MSNLSGVLSVFMFVTMPSGRDKRVSLALIPCDYEDREAIMARFIEDNSIRVPRTSLHAEFILRDPVYSF